MASMTPVAHILTDFPSKFGVPRQSGLAPELKGRIVFVEEYRNPDALRGIEGYSHLWLIWEFSESVSEHWSPTVRPPRLGGNTRMGVFATRSPFRPNPLGLSCVRLEKVEYHTPEGPVLHVRGADLVSHTPIYDIKPYLPYADCHPEATGGFSDSIEIAPLKVDFPFPLLSLIPEDQRKALLQVLSQDPRPGYRGADDPKCYGMAFGEYNVRFTVQDDLLRVVEVRPL